MTEPYDFEFIDETADEWEDWMEDCGLKHLLKKESPRKTAKFKAVERDRDHLWIRLREGEKKGLQFAVPDEGVAKDIVIGEVYELTLISLNERNTAWAIIDTHDA